MKDLYPEVDQQAASKHFTVAIDFGTAFSSVSFIALGSPETKRRRHPNQICSIEQYPYAPSVYYDWRKEAPIESWYPRAALRDDVCDNEPQDMSAELTRDDSSEDGSDSTPQETHHVDTPADPVGDDEEEGGEAEEAAAARASGTTASSSLSKFMPSCTMVSENQCTDV